MFQSVTHYQLRESLQKTDRYTGYCTFKKQIEIQFVFVGFIHRDF